jgi:rRNA maturation protein Nop10
MPIATRVGPLQSGREDAYTTESEIAAAGNTPFTAHPARFGPLDDGCLSCASSDDPSSGEAKERGEQPPTKRSCVEGSFSAALVKEEVESCFCTMPGLSTKGIRLCYQVVSLGRAPHPPPLLHGRL